MTCSDGHARLAVTRPPSGHRGRWRVLLRALLYWGAVATPLGAILAAHEWADRAARHAHEAERASRLALAERVFAGDLAAARSDLQMLGAMRVVLDYVEKPEPERKAALARDLSAFVATRPWCRGLTLTAAGDGGVEPPLDRLPCGRAADSAAALPVGELELETVSTGDASSLLCLARSLGPDARGGRWALVAEVDLPSWAGSAPGAWRLLLPEAIHDASGLAPRRHKWAFAILMLVLTGAAAAALAWSVEVRRRAQLLAVISHEMRTPPRTQPV
jgi:hypothetical protein